MPVQGTLATRGTMIAIGAAIAIATSAVTAIAVRAGAGATPNQAPVLATTGIVGAAPRDTVTVLGEGVEKTTPDSAEISLGVSTKAGSASDAMSTANSQMTRLLNAIKAQGVQPADIQTTAIGVNQQWNGYVVTNYQATNIVTVKVHHLNNVGMIIGAAQQAVGDNIQLNGITLELSDNSALLKAARQAAMTAATARAKEWAALAGRQLGKVLSVSEVVGNTGVAVPICGYGGGCGGGGGGAPIQAGQTSVTVDVAVVYELV